MMAFGFGGLMMLIVVGLPILVIVLVLAGAAGISQGRIQNISSPQPQATVSAPFASPAPTTAPAQRFCSHCGAGLQPDWTHCPQCGAPIQ